MGRNTSLYQLVVSEHVTISYSPVNQGTTIVSYSTAITITSAQTYLVLTGLYYVDVSVTDAGSMGLSNRTMSLGVQIELLSVLINRTIRL